MSEDIGRNRHIKEGFDEQFSEWLYDQLYEAYLRARKGKRRTKDEFIFEINEGENLLLLRDDIINRTYKPSRGIAFVIHQPVIREVFAAPFRDRVVHHFLYNTVYDWWDRRLIYDSYSCREGKGTLFGIERLDHHIRKVSQQYSRETYVIKLDIQGYFMSLPRTRLYSRAIWGLDRQFPKGGRVYETCKFLWREIIFDEPCAGVKKRGGEKSWKKLPDSKSLFCQPPGRGIVIGNLSSQLLSNIYLDTFDRFVTMQLGYKHYGRYVDDFYIVVTREELDRAMKDVEVMEDVLLEMGLTLHPNKRYIQNVRHGVAFLGATIYPHHIVPGRRVIRNFKNAIREGQGEGNYVESVTSYMGHMAHFDSKRAIGKCFEEVGWEYKF